jgi:hypothetical protein
MLHHRVCGACKLAFNAKTGGSNTRAIVIYQVVTLAVAFGVLGAVWAWNGARQVSSFVQGCTGGCVKAGTSHDECVRLCECVATDLRRDGDAHFRQILSETARTGTPTPELGEAAARCRGQ